jgi:hypothetical protein
MTLQLPVRLFNYYPYDKQLQINTKVTIVIKSSQDRHSMVWDVQGRLADGKVLRYYRFNQYHWAKRMRKSLGKDGYFAVDKEQAAKLGVK